jgi:hypothetical protein
MKWGVFCCGRWKNVPHLFVKPGILEFVGRRLTSSPKCSDSPRPALVSIHSSKAANKQNSSTLESSPGATFHLTSVLVPGCGYFLYLRQNVRCCGWRRNILRAEADLNVIQRSPKWIPGKLCKILNMKQPVITRRFMNSEMEGDASRNQLKTAFRTKRVVCCLLPFACSVSTPDRLHLVAPRNRFRISNWNCYVINRIHKIWQPAIFTPIGS